MQKFLSIHTLPPGRFTRAAINQFAQAAQKDPVVRGYRSFANLTEGKAVCILEAPDKEALAAWFKKMAMPTDTITPLELEGHCGTIEPV